MMSNDHSLNISFNMNTKDTEVYNAFEEKGYKITSFINRSTPIGYVCKCGETKQQKFKDFNRNKECRSCKTKAFEVETCAPDVPDEIEESGEIWRRIPGGWVSSFGRAKNVVGKLCTLCPLKNRYHVNKRHEYAGRLVAMGFKISDWEKLNTQEYIVTHIDGDEKNNHVDNLRILAKWAIVKTRTSTSEVKKKQYDLNELENVTVPEFSHWKICSNGEIWNGFRFLEFSKDGDYYKLCYSSNAVSIYVHRLICYAFHRLEGKTSFSEYKDFQVNHKDGNKRNNDKSNLEWVTKSENINHSYASGLNKKVRGVKQYNRETKEFIKEFPSLAQASRETTESEHHIREYLRGKPTLGRKYDWVSCDPEKDKLNSAKYSHY